MHFFGSHDIKYKALGHTSLEASDGLGELQLLVKGLLALDTFVVARSQHQWETARVSKCKDMMQ